MAALRRLLLLAICMFTVVITGTTASRFDLFVPTPRYPCFRQPAIAAVGKDNTVLLAFAENRNITSCAPSTQAVSLTKTTNSYVQHPDEVGSLNFRRSTDGGKTWSAMATLYVGNIDFYMVTPDATGMKVVLLLEANGINAVIESADAGATWSVERSLVVTLPKPFKSIKPSVGHGIVIDATKCVGGCKHAGRMVVPMVCTNASTLANDNTRTNDNTHTNANTRTSDNVEGDKGACPSCNACLIFSDDAGETWEFGGFGPAGSRESEVAQVSSGTTDPTLYMNARNMGPTPGHRMIATCTNAGEQCSNYRLDMTLVAPVTDHWTGIVDGISSLPSSSSSSHLSNDSNNNNNNDNNDNNDNNNDNNYDAIVFTGASNATARANITMRTSHDGGASWSPATVIWGGLGAYSDVVAIANSDPPAVAIICENGEKTFADRVSVFVTVV